MRKFALTLLSAVLISGAFAQIPTYKWVGGNQETNTPNNITRTEPGPRYNSGSWIDVNGDLWLYGGRGIDRNDEHGYFNDLWKYDVGENEWLYMDGREVISQTNATYNNSLKFDGIDDYIILESLQGNLESMIDYRNDFTWELWFKTEMDGTLMALANPPVWQNYYFDGLTLNIQQDGQLWLDISDFAGVKPVAGDLRDNQWHHIAVVFDMDYFGYSDKITFYVDGEELETEIVRIVAQGDFNNFDELDFNSQIDDYDDHLTVLGYTSLAYFSGGGGNYFNGQLDEVRIWNYARSSTEIRANYNISLKGTEDGLAAYYEFNQGETDGVNFEEELLDSGPNYFNGTLYNFQSKMFYKGEIAEFRQWDVVKTEDEIKENLFLDLLGSETSLVALYNFEEGIPESDNTSISNILDVTPSGNDGNLIGFSLQGNNSNYVSTEVARHYFSGSGADDIVLGDANEDGYDDIFLPNRYEGTISVLLNNQNGGFDISYEYFSGDYTIGITVGYFNNDLHLDIATTNLFSDDVRIYFGDGTGDFSSSITIDTGVDSRPYDIKSDDLDDDGDYDLVVSLNGISTVRVYYADNDGSGNFSTYVDYSVEDEPRFISLGDFDGNTEEDIAVATNFNGTINILLNDGNGAMTAEGGNYYFGNGVRDIITSDFNDDGFLDLATSNQGSQDLAVLIGNNDGSFQEASFYYSGNWPWGLLDVDVNNNGIKDIVVCNRSDGQLKYFINDGDGNFTDGEFIDISLGTPTNLALVDINKDGEPEMVVPNMNNSTVTVLEDYGNGYEIQRITKNALNFDGKDDHIEIPNLLPNTGATGFTWELWIKPDEDGTVVSFTREGTGNIDDDPDNVKTSLEIFVRNGFLVYDAWWVGGRSFAPVVVDGNWHHLALTIEPDFDLVEFPDGNDLVKIYLDGVLRIEDTPNLIETLGVSEPDFLTKLGYGNDNFPDSDERFNLSQLPESNWTSGVEFIQSFNGRANALELTDNNNDFILFGGSGIDENGNSGYLGDLQVYNTETSNWTTLAGANSLNMPGDYGTMDISSPTNRPGARALSRGWIDSDNNIWIIGGFGYDEAGTLDYLNDLWLYDRISNEWIWKGGNSLVNDLGNYGTLGETSPSSFPSSRNRHLTWVDANGMFWLFGGYGYDSNGALGYLNDLWMLNPNSMEWTWVSGQSTVNHAGEYGIQGVTNVTNYPGGRSAAISWLDSNGKVWIFGGAGLGLFEGVAGTLNDLWSYDPSSNMWTWESGPNFLYNTGNYFEQGASSIDYIPGSRAQADAWIDTEDNLYLFGGQKFSLGYNDLWRFNTITKEWTWLSGRNSIAGPNDFGTYSNLGEGSIPYPGARIGAATWTDEDGNLWMMGGNADIDIANGLLPDMWFYETERNLWTYKGGGVTEVVGGSEYGIKGLGDINNIPPSRVEAVSWTGDSGKLWFFGGCTPKSDLFGEDYLNDLWSYNPDDGLYTWEGGDNIPNQSGVYGERGVPSVGKIPGARREAVGWKDSNGMLWLFGGEENSEWYNDLWMFNPHTYEWTWVSGYSSQDIPGFYGVKGEESEGNVVGSRFRMSGWADNDGNFWIFGGTAVDSRGLGQLYMNDLWKYNAASGMWTWVKGSDVGGSTGNYGILGVASEDNEPPARYNASSWTDDSGNLWLKGGYGPNGIMNDLWKFEIETEMWTWMGGSMLAEALDQFGSKGMSDEANVIGARLSSQVFKGNKKNVWLFGGFRTVNPKNDLWEIEFTPGTPKVQSPFIITQDQATINYNEAWAEAYQIQLSDINDYSTILQDFTVENDTARLEPLNPGQYYHYKVKAINSIGESEYSESKDFLTLPATPIFENNAVSSFDQTFAVVDWFSNSGVFSGYEMEVSRDSTFQDPELFLTGYMPKIISKDAVRDTINGVLPGTYYYVRLKAYNETGYSPYSSLVEILTLPETPSLIGSGIETVGQIAASIAWNSVPEVMDGYVLEVSYTETFDDYLAGYDHYLLGEDITSFTISGLNPGSNYYARISSYNSSGLSNPSEIIPLLTLPETPLFTGNVISDITQSSAVVNWSEVPEIFEGYHLEVSIDDEFSNNAFFLSGYGKDNSPKSVDKVTSNDTISGLSPGSTYYVRVRAYNASGDSPNSNIISVVTVPASPDFTSISNITQTSASVTWSNPTGTELYLIDISRNDIYDLVGTILLDYPVAVPFYIFEDLEPGTTYYTRVQSENAGGASGHMNPPDHGDTLFITIPATPFIESPTEITQTTMQLDWDELLGAEGYYVDVSENGFQTLLTSYNAALATTNSFLIEGLSAGQDYQVRLRSFNTSGNSPNSSTLSVLMVPPTPTARDATTVSANTFTANWDQVEGAGYYILEVSADDFDSLIHQETYSFNTPVRINNLQEGTVYKYRVRSGNVSGESPNSNEVQVTATNNASSLSISSVSYSEEFNRGSTSTTINVSLTGGQGNTSASIRYKGLMGQVWADSLALNGSGNSYSFEITNNMLDEVGVEFDVFASDGFSFPQSIGNVIYWSFEDSNSDAIPIVTFGGGAGDWQLFSIPYVLDDNLIETVFNEMGQYEYKSQWRLMHFDGTKYVDFGAGINRIELGKGYWFNAQEETEVFIGKGKVNNESIHEMTLRQGWNQIGNPFNVPISWNSVRITNEVGSSVESIILFDSDDQEFVDGDMLAPFEGGFVWADEATAVEISLKDNHSGSRMLEETISERNIDSEEWLFSLNLNSNESTYAIAEVGMHPDAKIDKDEFDKMLLPRFLDYVDMYSAHNQYFYPWFKTDIAPRDKSYNWLYTLESNHIDGPLKLEWDNSAFQNSISQLWIIDEHNGKVINLSEVEEYTFNFKGKHQFSIHYTENKSALPVPYLLNLGEPFPNPTDGLTQITVSLPEGNHEYEILLELLDINGRQVEVLTEGIYTPGVHTFQTDGTVINDLQNGVYLYRLSFKNSSIKPGLKKLVINK